MANFDPLSAFIMGIQFGATLATSGAATPTGNGGDRGISGGGVAQTGRAYTATTVTPRPTTARQRYEQRFVKPAPPQFSRRQQPQKVPQSSIVLGALVRTASPSQRTALLKREEKKRAPIRLRQAVMLRRQQQIQRRFAEEVE
jgi:hypothetical protein